MIKNLISVIIPFKNEELYVLECLNSIATQKANGFDIEVILIDDHSSDNSSLMVQNYCKNNSSFYYLLNENSGIIDALNLGLEKSKGNFIHRMDADDVMPNNKLQNLFDILILNTDTHIATGKIYYFRNDKSLGAGFKRYQSWLNNLVDTNSYYSQIYKECSVASANWLIRKKDLLSVGGFGSNYPEDYDLLFRFYQAEFLVKGTKEVTHHWRDHQERASRNDEHYLDQNFLELKIKWFLDIDFDETKDLIVFGAGKKGKLVAKKLIKKGVCFQWLTNNAKKVGVDIYGVILKHEDKILKMNNFQCLVFVANPDEQSQIIQKFNSTGFTLAKDYYLMC